MESNNQLKETLIQNNKMQYKNNVLEENQHEFFTPKKKNQIKNKKNNLSPSALKRSKSHNLEYEKIN